jgi:iron(III) transport system substrate-binding protein
MDLAQPQWKGRWAASPSGADFQAIVSAMLALKGEQATLAWLKAMKTNFVAYKGNSTVMKAVNAGQIDGGVIYHYYRFVDQAKTGENSKNTRLHYFKNQDPGAFVSISGGGVLAPANIRNRLRPLSSGSPASRDRMSCAPITPLNMPLASTPRPTRS